MSTWIIQCILRPAEARAASAQLCVCVCVCMCARTSMSVCVYVCVSSAWSAPLQNGTVISALTEGAFVIACRCGAAKTLTICLCKHLQYSIQWRHSVQMTVSPVKMALCLWNHKKIQDEEETLGSNGYSSSAGQKRWLIDSVFFHGHLWSTSFKIYMVRLSFAN